jgi:tRNA modification GTPase
MDTIFATASAPGKAGVAIVRVSGPLAFDVCQRLAGVVPPPRQMVLRVLKDAEGGFLDQAMIVVFAEGASFTGEKVLELHLHGSVAVIRAVLTEIGHIPGCRLAEPGEFTRRAFDNENLDLTQVEGLADLIESDTEAQRKQALRTLSGDLSSRIAGWRAKLLRAAALLEATIDFVDEDVPFDVAPEVIELLGTVQEDLALQLAGLASAEKIRTGFEVAIVGPPNAGKSTLLNYLAGRDAAITSEIAGTTRDVIEVRMEIGGLSVTLLDTAGMRETADPIERLGVDLAKRRAEQADLRIHLRQDPSELVLTPSEDDIVLYPKDDAGELADGVSGRTGHGVPALLNRIESLLSDRVANASLVSRERHRAILVDAQHYLSEALDRLSKEDENTDLIAEDVRLAARRMESLVGRLDVEQLLGEIFSSFCIGK